MLNGVEEEPVTGEVEEDPLVEGIDSVTVEVRVDGPYVDDGTDS